MKRALVIAVMFVTVFTSLPTFAANERDIDFDWAMGTIDNLLKGFAPSFSYPLKGRDSDGNGIREEDSMALLSHILRGGTRQGSLNATECDQIRADFAYNRTQVESALTIRGNISYTLTIDACTAMSQGFGFPCRLVDLLRLPEILGGRGQADVVDTMLEDLLAGLATVGDSPATFSFINNYVRELILAFAGTMDSSLIPIIMQIYPGLNFAEGSFRHWGNSPTGGKVNYFGPLGTPSAGGTNLAKYNTNGGLGNPNREGWLGALTIASPAMHITSAAPVGTYQPDVLGCLNNYTLQGGAANWTLTGWQVTDIHNVDTNMPSSVPPNLVLDATATTNSAVQTNANMKIPLIQNALYRITFSVYLRTGGRVDVALGTNWGGDHAAGGWDGNGSKTYDIVAGGPNPSLTFVANIQGGGDNTFWTGCIDNVIVRKLALSGEQWDMGAVTVAGGNTAKTIAWEESSHFCTEEFIRNPSFQSGTGNGDGNFNDWTPGAGWTTTNHEYAILFGAVHVGSVHTATFTAASGQLRQTAAQLQRPLVPGRYYRVALQRYSGTGNISGQLNGTPFGPAWTVVQGLNSGPFSYVDVICGSTDNGDFWLQPASAGQIDHVSISDLTLYLVQMADVTNSYHGTATTNLFFDYLLPSYNGWAPWLRLSDNDTPSSLRYNVYDPPPFVASDYHNPPPGAAPLGPQPPSTWLYETDGLGGKTSAPSQIEVAWQAFAVLTNPADKKLYVGDTYTVTARVVGGNTVPTYTWYKGAGSLGGNTPGLTLTNVALGDAGLYKMHASNGADPDVETTQANIQVADAVSFSPPPAGANKKNGDSHTFTASPAGGYPPYSSYQWLKDGAVIVGATNTTLALTGLTYANQGLYSVRVNDTNGGPFTSPTAALTVLEIQNQPVAATIFSGQTLTFGVTVRPGSGLGAYTYQWKKDGVDILNATNASYSKANAVPADEGSYSCVVKDAALATITTNAASATVTEATIGFTTQPAGGNQYVGGSHTFTVVPSGGSNQYGSGYTFTYLWQHNGITIGGATSSSLTISPLVSGDAGTYQCFVGENPGVRPPRTLVQSNLVTLNVANALSFSTNPVGGNKAVGDSHSFTAVATGGYGPYTYQWLFGAAPVGSNSTGYNIASLLSTQQGTYHCHVSEPSGGAADSAFVLLTVLAIQTQPVSVEVNEGSPADISVVVLPGSGTGSYHYQWKKNGVNIGTDSATYSVGSAGLGDAGSYRCVVTDTGGAFLQSNAATLSVVQQPIVISVQPSGGNKYVGGSHTFSVTATGGNGTLTYKWQKGGVDIPSATNFSYTIDPLALTDQGDYQCLVGDLAHPPQALVGTNTVNLQVRDAFAKSVEPTGGNKAVGGSHTFTFGVTGGYNTPAITYQWYKAGVGISGATLNSLTLSPLVTTDQASYYCIATDSNPSGGSTLQSNTVSLTVLGIQTSPASREVAAGASTTFTVTLVAGSGLPNYTYQWRKDGVNIGSPTTTSAVSNPYTDSNCQPADQGAYDCVITDAGGATLTSTPAANLTVVANPIIITVQPASGQKYAGQNHTFSVTATAGAGTLTWQWYKGSTALTGRTTSSFTINPLATTDDGTYYCLLGDTNHGDPPKAYGYTSTSVATLQVRAGVAVSPQPAGGRKAVGDTHTFTVGGSGGYPPLNYTWQKSTIPAGTWTTVYTGGASYALSPLAAGDQGSYRCTVRDSWTASTNSATVALYVLAVGTPPASQTVNVGDPVTFNIVPIQGQGAYTYQWAYQGTNIAGATTSSYNIGSCQAGSPTGSPVPLNPTGRAGDYTCTVKDNNGAAGFATLSATATLTVNYTPMSLSTPLGANLYTGGSHTFTTTASGGAGAAYTYQWQKDGIDIPNATTNTYSISSAGTTNAGLYVCMGGMVGVRPPLPLVPSSGATLNVNDPITIDAQPVGANKAAGDSHTFSISASGGYPPLSYQWYRSGTAVGANLPTLALTGLTGANQGTYTCVVSDTNGASVPSEGKDLTVLAIETQPAPQTVDAFQPASMSVAMVAGSGVPPYSYVWTYKGTPIPGATNATYSIASAQAGSPDANPGPLNPTGNAGDYQCTVVDSALVALTSDVAGLAVNALPIIFTTQPVSSSIYIGSPVTFSVAVSGGAGPAKTYQWRKGGTDLPGMTMSTYTIDPVGLSDGDVYDCVVGEVGVRPPQALVPSNVVTLSVAPMISIDTQPTGADIYAGETYTTSVTASGGFGTLKFQWYHGTTAVPGATDSTLNHVTVLADAGSYHCDVSDENIPPATVSSGSVTLTLTPPVTITTQPANALKILFESCQFFVVASGGKGTLHYQWMHYDAPVGTDSATFTINSITIPDAGQYKCVVTDSGTSSATSDVASLSIEPIYGFDVQPQSQRLYVGSPFSVSAHVVFNSGAVTYQWYQNGVSYEGATDASFGGTSADPTYHSGVWHVTATDDMGTPADPADDRTITSADAVLQIAYHLTIDSAPVGGTAPAGLPFTFSVGTIGGFSPLTYQWFKGSDAITGATNASYTIPQVQLGNAGAYHVTVFDAVSDTATSGDAVLVVSDLPMPVGGAAGLALLVGAIALRGLASVRRRK